MSNKHNFLYHSFFLNNALSLRRRYAEKKNTHGLIKFKNLQTETHTKEKRHTINSTQTLLSIRHAFFLPTATNRMKNKSAQSLKRRRKNKTGTTRKAQISEFESRASRICIFSYLSRPLFPLWRETPSSDENNSNFIYTAGKKRTRGCAEGPSGKIRQRLSAGRFY